MTDLQIVGSGKVELFDADTLRKVSETPFRNYIAASTTAYNKWRVRQEYRTSHPNAQSDPAPTLVLSHFVLSSDSRLEASQTDFQGAVVGWSNKSTYSGSSLTRGTPNVAESQTTSAMARWVFDWPTHAANGQFSSLVWTSLNESTLVATTIGARALLAAPVVKDSTRTLKITYQFDFV